jgi:hypothetical protein
MASVCRVPIVGGSKIEILPKHAPKVQEFLKETGHVFRSENELRSFIAGVVPSLTQKPSALQSASA